MIYASWLGLCESMEDKLTNNREGWIGEAKRGTGGE